MDPLMVYRSLSDSPEPIKMPTKMGKWHLDEGSGPADDTLDNGVMIMDGFNFHIAMDSIHRLVILFYTPWCAKSKALMPIYEKAAKAIKKTGWFGSLAKVNVEQNREVATRYKIRKVPRIGYFTQGDFVAGFDENEAGQGGGIMMDEYNITSWIRQVEPGYEILENASFIHEFLEFEGYNTFNVLMQAPEGSPEALAFEKVSEEMRDYNARVSNVRFAILYVEGNTTMVLNRPMFLFFGDEANSTKLAVFPKVSRFGWSLSDPDDITKWIKRKTYAVKGFDTAFNAQKFSFWEMEPFDTAGHPWNCVVLLVNADGEGPQGFKDPEDPKLQALQPSFRQRRQSCKFIVVRPGDVDDRAMKMMALKGDIRTMGSFLAALIHVESEGHSLHKYFLHGEEKLANHTEVSLFLESALNLTGVRHFQSSDLPDPADDWPPEYGFTTLVGANFNQFAMDMKKDVLVMFHGSKEKGDASQRALLGYKSLGRWAKQQNMTEKGVLIATFDLHKNECIDWDVPGTPRLVLYPAIEPDKWAKVQGMNDVIKRKLKRKRIYHYKPTLDPLKEFVLTQCTNLEDLDGKDEL